MREEASAPRLTWIYALCEPGGVNPRYVGKTFRGLSIRHKDHLRASRRAAPPYPVHRWIKKLYKRGSWSCILALELVATDDDWEARERFWIQTLREKGHALLNLTDGGGGTYGRSRPPEEIERIRKGKRNGATFPCQTCGVVFYRKKIQIARGHNKFCSHRCSNARHKGKSLFDA